MLTLRPMVPKRTRPPDPAAGPPTLVPKPALPGRTFTSTESYHRAKIEAQKRMYIVGKKQSHQCTENTTTIHNRTMQL